MKNVAVLALIVGFFGSNIATADNAFSEKPTMILAYNSITADQSWMIPAPVDSIDTDAIDQKIELKVSKSLDKMSLALEKQLEDKLAKDFVYAMQ